MKHIIILTIFLLVINISSGQKLISIGDKAPKYNFTNVLNAPDTDFDLSNAKGKATILAFWGTWCATCIPEIVNLGKLQNKFGNKVQMIGVSNDNEQRLTAFLEKYPSKIWFASDPSDNLWSIFGIDVAGHAVLIDQQNNIVAFTETKKIDSQVINNLLSNNKLTLPDDRGLRRLAQNEDPINLDSNTLYSFILQPEIKGVERMMKRPNVGIFGKRRITMVNLRPETILREAYDISIPQKVFYQTKDDSLKSNQKLYTVDFVVSKSDESNLKTLFQNELNRHLPVKAEIQRKYINCYVLQPIVDKNIVIKQSIMSGNEFSYNGLGFEGEGVLMNTFVNYLENELDYPVYDATMLTDYYDIKFERNNIEPMQSTKESLAKLGLELVKSQKEMDVLVITAK